MSSSARFSGFISIEGRICGGATARVVISRSMGLVVLKPRIRAESFEIFMKRFRTSLAL